MTDKILQRDAPVLREIAKPIPLPEIKSTKLKEIIARMKRALHVEKDGVAIAAPQIGESVRVFVTSGAAMAWISNKKNAEKSETLDDLVFINPEIIKSSKKKKVVEEGCLSVRWLYGEVKRSEKVTIRAYDEKGKLIERGASGLLAQIFQHEIDHLNGILFTDKAKNLRDVPPTENVKFAFFGSSPFSNYVLEELEEMGFSPMLKVSSARNILPMEKLKALDADVFVVASFGKILPKELLELPKHGVLNIHPSLLPQLRGPSPIQETILGHGESGVSIIRLDEKVDHGPILAQAKVVMDPWPDHYETVEKKLAEAGARLFGTILPKWLGGELKEHPQDDALATYSKLVKKEDGLINLNDSAELNWRKVLAYSHWPGAYMIYTNKKGREVRIVVKDAQVKDGEFNPTRVIPAGKREMSWQDFLRGN